jgi:coenzyme F420-reducing hydrogenase delta subunit
MKNQSLRISLFYCANSFSTEEISHSAKQVKDVELTSISLPCSGKVNLLYLLKAIETGSDAVMLMTCNNGECKFLQGNIRAQKRTDAVADLLEESGLSKEHIKYVQITGDKKIENIINELDLFSKQLQSESQMKRKNLRHN